MRKKLKRKSRRKYRSASSPWRKAQEQAKKKAKVKKPSKKEIAAKKLLQAFVDVSGVSWKTIAKIANNKLNI